MMRYAPIAQLDRVTDYESVGRGFESLSAYQKYQIPSQVSGIFIYVGRESNNSMRMSGGHSLVAGLDGDNTLVYRVPVAVPDKIFGLTLFLDFIDRCHSLTSLILPQAALGSLPPFGAPSPYGMLP